MMKNIFGFMYLTLFNGILCCDISHHRPFILFYTKNYLISPTLPQFSYKCNHNDVP